MAFSYDAPLPGIGLPVRLQLTGVQWLLERDAHSCRCVAIGREILYQGLLALPEQGHISLQCEPPRQPVEFVFEQPLVFAPRTGMQGWIALPLLQSLRLRDPDARQHELVVVEEPGLTTAWREELGYFHGFRGRLDAEPRRLDEDDGLRFWVRVRFRNGGKKVRTVERLHLDMRNRELWAVRGGVPIGPGLRVRLDGKKPELSWREVPILSRREFLENRYGTEEA